MEPGFATALAPFALGCALAMASVRWGDNDRARHLCGIGAAAFVFIAAGIVGSAMLGLIGMNLIQRLSICFGVVLLAFGLLYPLIERYAGFAKSASPSAAAKPMKFLEAQILGRRGDNDEYLLAARLQFNNDGDEVKIQWSAAETLGLSINDDIKRAENIVKTRALAKVVSAPIGTFNVPKGPGVLETPPLTVTREAYDQYFSGRRTFYFAGILKISTLSGNTTTQEVCGYSPGDPRVVLQCPD